MAALPGVILAALAFAMREPLCGAAEPRGPNAASVQGADPRAFGRLLRIRSLLTAVLANTFVLFASTGVGGVIAIYTTRRFGVDLAHLRNIIEIPLLLGAFLGNTLGGWLVDWRSRVLPRAHLEIAVVASALCAVGVIATFSAGTPADLEMRFLPRHWPATSACPDCWPSTRIW